MSNVLRFPGNVPSDFQARAPALPPVLISIGLVVWSGMRYLVKARVKPGKELELLEAIQKGTLGAGSVAGDEYLRDMEQARLVQDGTANWVEVCYCAEPLQEERSYWEEYFDLISVEDAHDRANCKHENGKELWACSDCSCTRKLEQRLRFTGTAFLEELKKSAGGAG